MNGEERMCCEGREGSRGGVRTAVEIGRSLGGRDIVEESNNEGEMLEGGVCG